MAVYMWLYMCGFDNNNNNNYYYYYYYYYHYYSSKEATTFTYTKHTPSHTHVVSTLPLRKHHSVQLALA